MAKYKKQATAKYYGLGGTGKVYTNTQSDGLAKSLDNAGYLIQNAENTRIDREKTEAINKIQELYASGKKVEDIQAEILANKHPDLTGKYIDATTKFHTGKVQANEVFNKIKENIQDYDIEDTSQSLELFIKPFLPNFEGMDKSQIAGFSSTFNGFKAVLAEEDANARSALAQANKIKEGRTVLANTSLEKYIETWKNLNMDVPSTDGSSKPNQLYTNADLIEVIKADVKGLIKTATTIEEIERAEAILNLDMGLSKDGKKLGTLGDRKTGDIDDIKLSLIVKKEAIEADQIRKEAKYKDDTVKEIYKEAFAPNEDGSAKTLTQLNEIKEKLKEFGDPKLLDEFVTFFNSSRTIVNDADKTNEFLMSVAEGKYETYAEMIEAMNTEGIPSAFLEKAENRWTTWSQNRDKGDNPIYFSDKTYTSGTATTTNFVEKYLDKLDPSGTLSAEAMPELNSYIKNEILDFEADFKAENNGASPKPEDRRKFMEELYKWVKFNYQEEGIVMPKGLVSFDQKEINEQELEDTRERLDTANIASELINTIQNAEFNIPVPFGEDSTFKDYKPFNQPDKDEYNATRNKAIEDAVASVFPEGTFTTEFINSMNQQEADLLKITLAEQLGIPPEVVAQTIKTLLLGNN
tara:strand:- start:4928 stop:6835 length:1908 start_codon:yes stop_codon:yes gene_type:complete